MKKKCATNTFRHPRWTGTGKRLISAFVFCLWLLPAGPASAEEIGIKASANRNQIYIGESFILEVTVSGSSSPAEIDFGQVSNAKIRALGSRNISNFQITIINGKITREGFTGFVSSYEITPLAAGQFQAGPINVQIGDQRLRAAGPAVLVTDIEKQDRVILSVSTSRETTLIDEPFAVTLSLKIKCLPGDAAKFESLLPDQPPALTIPWLDQEMKGLAGPDLRQLLTNLLAPHWNQPGVTINKFTLAPDPFDLTSMLAREQRKAKFALPKRIISLNNQAYYEYNLRFDYLPKDEGNYVFGPVIFKGAVPERLNEYGRPVSVNIFAVGPAGTVRVIPPPDEGRPESWSGAIGSNLAAKAALDADKCNIGDPLKLTLTVSGQVKLDKLLPPKLSLQTNILQRFTVYDNTVQAVKKDFYNQYIYTVRPNQAGDYEFPPVELAFYDVISRSYKKIFTAPLPLQVRRGAEITAAQVIGRTNQPLAAREEFDLRKQIPAPIRLDNAGAAPASIFGDQRAAAGLAAGPLLYLLTALAGLLRRSSRKIRLARHKKSAQFRAGGALKKALRLSRSAPAPAAGLICEALRKYLGERLGRDTAALTPPETGRLLKENGIGAELAENFSALYEKYFNAGFAGTQMAGDIAADYQMFRELIQRLENEFRKKH